MWLSKEYNCERFGLTGPSSAHYVEIFWGREENQMQIAYHVQVHTMQLQAFGEVESRAKAMEWVWVNYIYEIHMAQTNEKWIIRDSIDNLGEIFSFVFTLGP